ncbi:hypothetical protein, partial [Winogradskyella sp. PE311]|uniref:hypothetical protein n=1 Tax=Winogradskyella sp. PE311 TaxID=3366943 RepID=UPI003980574B
MKKLQHYRGPNLRLTSFLLFFILLFNQNVSAQTDCGSIESFEFTNGHESLGLNNNGIYELIELPDNFYVKALVHGHIGSVRFRVENVQTGEITQIIENLVPYTFPAGNSPWNLGSGVFRIKATVFSQNNAHGETCSVSFVTFTLSDEEPCTAEAGTLTAVASSVCSTG